MEHSCFQGKHKFHNFDKFTYMCYNCYNYHNLLITSASTKRQPSIPETVTITSKLKSLTMWGPLVMFVGL